MEARTAAGEVVVQFEQEDPAKDAQVMKVYSQLLSRIEDVSDLDLEISDETFTEEYLASIAAAVRCASNLVELRCRGALRSAPLLQRGTQLLQAVRPASLRGLWLESCPFLDSDLHAQLLGASIKQQSRLVELEIVYPGSDQCSDAAIFHFAHALKTLPLLESLQLEQFQAATTRGLDALVDSIAAIPKLSKLRLFCCQFSAERVASVLSRSRALEVLSIGLEGSHRSRTEHLWKAVGESPSIREVSCNLLPQEDTQGIGALEHALASSSSLTKLALCTFEEDEQNPLGGGGSGGDEEGGGFECAAVCGPIADGVLRNPNSRLRKLTLERLPSGKSYSEGEHLARLLSSCSTLRRLCVGGPTANEASGDDAWMMSQPGEMSALLKSLASPLCALEELRLWVGWLDDEADAAFEQVLASPGSTLRTIELGRCNADATTLACIAGGLKRNSTLQTLKIVESHVTSDAKGVAALADALATNDTLTSLDLSNNGIADYPPLGLPAAEALSSALAANHSLVQLDMSSTPFAAGAEDAIAEGVGENMGLVVADLAVGSGPAIWHHCARVVQSNVGLASLGLAPAGQRVPKVVARGLVSAIRSAPGLLQLLGADYESLAPGVPAALASDRSSVVRKWLGQTPRVDRAACSLRMLAGPHGSGLEVGAVLGYATRALQHAAGAGSAGECLVVLQAVLEGERRELFPREVCLDTGVHEVVRAVGAHGTGRDGWGGCVSRCEAVLGLEAGRRRGWLARWRRARRAHEDASRVFAAASEGRHLELAKRLELGKHAGGARARGMIRHGGRKIDLAAIEAALIRGHWNCVQVLHDVHAVGY